MFRLRQVGPDPLRSLVYTAVDRAARDVFVNRRKVVENGRVLSLDRNAALDALTEVQQRMERTVPEARLQTARGGGDLRPSLPLMT